MADDPNTNGKNLPMRPQEHGGALRSGHGSDHPGSLSKHLRAKLRGSFADRVPILEAIADGVTSIKGKCSKCGTIVERPHDPPAVRDRLVAINMLARWGFQSGMPLDEVRSHLIATMNMIEATLPEDEAAKIITDMRKIWMGY